VLRNAKRFIYVTVGHNNENTNNNHMNYESRNLLYQKIGEIRKRPLISYVTSFRGNANASIASDVISHFLKQLSEIPKETDNIDLLIISYGGDPTVAYRIVNLLRERFKKFGVLLPYTAYSAATLISLGADEIIMHPFANLGPVDPQLTHKSQDKEIHFGSEDLRNFLDFVKSDVGISDQEQLQKSFELACKEVGAIPIGIAKRSSQLALSMGEKLLSLHMTDSNKAKTIAETLNKSFYHHGYPLGPTEAKKIGLPVINPNDELKELLHEVLISFENEMKFDSPFNPLEIVLSDPQTASLLAPVNQIQLPANLPSKILQQAYNNVLQQIQVAQIPPLDYDLFIACVESVYCKSHFRINGKIFSNRLPDNNISVNVIPVKSEWSFEKTTQE